MSIAVSDVANIVKVAVASLVRSRVTMPPLQELPPTLELWEPLADIKWLKDHVRNSNRSNRPDRACSCRAHRFSRGHRESLPTPQTD